MISMNSPNPEQLTIEAKIKEFLEQGGSIQAVPYGKTGIKEEIASKPRSIKVNTDE